MNLENALLATVTVFAMIIPLTAVGAGIKTLGNAHIANETVCDNYIVDCRTGTLRPCVQPDSRHCYPVGDVRRGGI